jgi:hypothetical protein
MTACLRCAALAGCVCKQRAAAAAVSTGILFECCQSLLVRLSPLMHEFPDVCMQVQGGIGREGAVFLVTLTGVLSCCVQARACCMVRRLGSNKKSAVWWL